MRMRSPTTTSATSGALVGFQMRVLLVEDEPDAARMVAKGLREHAYAVDVVGDGEAACSQAAAADYDAIVLDVLLPLKDGLKVCRQLRREGRSVPILMLTARDSVDARIAGLDSGADDYLTKPFDFGELLARLRALIRRGARPLLPERLRIADLELDTRAQRVFKRGRAVSLTTREYALLEYLARRAGEVVSRTEIAEHVWDDGYEAVSNVLDVSVRRLRRRLDDPGSESLIHTRRGAGYELVRGRGKVS
jgi:two-component system copper resistance phosphate regulon response regulator CusR